MFPKRFRLQASWFFNKTLKEGMRYYACPFFVIMALPHWHETGRLKALEDPHYRPRIGFVVSKKVHKRAVKRNRLKRIVREWMRQSLWQDDRYDWKGVASLAVVFRPDAVKVSEAEVLERIHHAFSPKHFKRLAELSPTTLEQVKGASDAS
ncbi:MAG: ribonuclease P protein component [Vampirovibrionales bacterium]|jgi:ribonuclease P protein component|nr:ribonuclease P protein component [Vampirovibrionales bacterium]